MLNIRQSSIFILLSLMVFSITFAQAQINNDRYTNLVARELQKLQPENQLIQVPMDYVVSSTSVSPQSQRALVYIQHTINEIPIKNAISIMAFNKDDELSYQRLSAKAEVRQDFTSPPPFRISGEQALEEALKYTETSEETILKNAPDFIRNSINVEKFYLNTEGRLSPIYQIELFLDITRSEVITIDALTGDVLKSYNKVLNCTPDIPSFAGSSQEKITKISDNDSDIYQYNVAPLPDINVLEKGRRLIPSPADTIASQIGWHNKEGVLDGKSNILEGNNIQVYIDRDGNWMKDDTVFADPDGKFDFPLNLNKEPENYVEASMTNLFVVNNQMHDILYHNYFDEEAGNYQRMNFEPVGMEDDPVIILGQSGAGDPNGGRNNALFYPTIDGSPGYMVMYIWGQEVNEGLKVLEPETIAGSYITADAQFTPSVQEHPVEGRVAIVSDDVGNPSDACEEIQNIDEIAGKIAIIDRGDCNFEDKIARAESAGAIAVIMVNNAGDDVIYMGGTRQAGIPAVMVGQSDGALLKAHIEDLYVLLGPDSTEGPVFRDGALDNTIPVHEYGHGISNRLVGGPAIADCLTNDEQMGEGWSDILAMILTMNDDNYMELNRSMGSYAYTNTVNGQGIRRKVYSPDFALNNYTYKDIYYSGSGPHSLGEIWTTFLWDLTQKLIEIEGFNEDLMYGNGGNRIALQLIIEGLKYTACNPGFVDGRDGILAADEALFGGYYSCLIWDVFAHRGLGYYADQVSSSNRREGVEDFHVNPYCDARIKVNKTVDQFVAPGDTVEVRLEVFNHQEGAAQQVFLTDSLPPDAEFIASTGIADLEYEAGKLFATIEDLAFQDTITYSYIYKIGSKETSGKQWANHLEDVDSFNFYFTGENLKGGSTNISWEPDSGKDNSGSINIRGVNNSDQVLQFNEPVYVDIDQPMVLIDHKYNLDQLVSAGFVEYSYDQVNWEKVDSSIVIGKYNSKIRGGDIPDSYNFGFSGNTDWMRTAIDLRQWNNQHVSFRLRLSTNTFGIENWYIDAVSYWDRLSYNPEVCVETSTSRDCYAAPGYGTVVLGDVDSATSIYKPHLAGDVLVHPQPFGETFQVNIPPNLRKDILSMKIVNTDGRVMKTMKKENEGNYIIDGSDWPSGMYFLQINLSDGRLSKKMIKQ